MTTSRARLFAVLLLVSGLVGILVAIPLMARRLHGRETTQVWFQEPLLGQDFVFRGEPVHITVNEASTDASEATTSIAVTFRGRALSFPIEPGMRDDPRFPGLKRFDDWLRVVPMVIGGATEAEVERGLASGELEPRLLIAIRRPAEGYDPDTWGLVRRKDWRYQFAVLDATGPVENAVEMVESTYSDLDPLGDPDYRRAAGRESELWKFQAMLQVTPATAYRSKNRPLAGTMAAMGWTWPLAALSIMGIACGGAGLALSSRRDD